MAVLPITLIIIESDPRTSHRPAEGIRLAAGIHVWKRTEIQVLFRDLAPYCLQEFHDELVDEDNYTSYLPMIRDSKIALWVDERFTDRESLAPELWPFKYVTSSEIAEIVEKSRNIITL